MRELLVVIDYQNDFVTGALGNPAAAALEPGIAARVAAQLGRGGRVLFTRDTHGTDYLNTREGRFLPVAHCIKGSQGWGLYGSLSQYETGVRDGVSIVDKPTFGCAALPAEAEALCGGAPDSIEICGVVTDICVVSNAVLLHSAFLNARVAVLKDLCAAATPEGHARALALVGGLGYVSVSQPAGGAMNKTGTRGRFEASPHLFCVKRLRNIFSQRRPSRPSGPPCRAPA